MPRLLATFPEEGRLSVLHHLVADRASARDPDSGGAMTTLDYATVARVLSKHIRNVDRLLAATDAVVALLRNDLSTHALRVEFLRTDRRAQQFLSAGQWIQAIKFLREESRERTGELVGLREAKDAVDALRGSA